MATGTALVVDGYQKKRLLLDYMCGYQGFERWSGGEMATDIDGSCKKGHHPAIFMGGRGFKKGFGGRGVNGCCWNSCG